MGIACNCSGSMSTDRDNYFTGDTDFWMKEWYYKGYKFKLTRKETKEFVMSNTDKTAVEIEWLLDVPVREDLYEYIVNE